MKRSKPSNNFKNLALPGIIAFGLIWALGLLGLGLWRNLQSSPPRKPLTPLVKQPQSSPERQLSDFSQAQDIPTGRFKYSGSPNWSPIRLVVDSVIQSERREFQLSYVQPVDQEINSTTAIQLLLQDRLDLAQSNRLLHPEEMQQAQNQGIELQQALIAIDGIAIAVHPSLPIKGLTLSELAKIYSGQISNWQDVGGPDLSIQPYSLPIGSDEVVDLFLKQVMTDDQSYGYSIDSSPDLTTALRKLADQPGGIFFGSAAEIVSQCSIKTLPISSDGQTWVPPYQLPPIAAPDCPSQRNQINSQAFLEQRYPLTYKLYVIIKVDGGKAEQAGRAYAQLLITEQGQDLIHKAGFASVFKRPLAQ